MIILGVDPGLTRCGVGVIEAGEHRRLSFIHVDVVRSSPDITQDLRLLAIYNGLSEKMDRFAPDAVSIERVFAQSNRNTVLGTAQAAGLAMLAAAQRNIPVALHTPTEAKLAITGNGQAQKIQVERMVTRILNLTKMPFWTPKFKWREKTLNYQLVKQAVDTKQRKGVSPIAIKLNQKEKNHTEKLEVFKLISDYLGYGGSKGKYGFQAYSQWQEYIKNLSNVFYLNHVDFNTLYEHFVVWEGIIKMLQREIGINNEIYSNFIKLENSAIKLRNLSIKFWLKRNAVDDEWRNIIVSKLEEIKQEEKDLLEKLYSENMLET